MAGLAGSIAEGSVNAGADMRSFFTVASRALYPRHFGGMGIILERGMAVVAGQTAVDAGCMLCGINRNAFAAGRSHSRLAVTGKTSFVLLQRMGGQRLCSNPSRHRHADREKPGG